MQSAKKTEPNTIYIIDSHPLMCDALGMLLKRIKPDIKITPLHKINALEPAILKGARPELIVMELQLPDTLGVSGVEMVRAMYPSTLLAVITSDSQSHEAHCLNAGANVFIAKTEPVNRMLEKLRNLMVGGDTEDEPPSAPPIKLTKRQKQMIPLLDRGLSNREIATMLNISEHTVKVHFWRLFRRLDVTSRTQALHFARTNGWLGI